MKKKTVLVADDSETFVMYFSLLLKRLGFDVIPAENGLEALKLIKVTEPNLVMLDIKMPVMDGITALRLLKGDKRTTEIPVIMVTTDAKKETIEECKRLGCSGYITKPVNISKIHEVLQESLYMPMGFRRRHMRATYTDKVSVSYNGIAYELYAGTLSEGGIYVSKKDSFPIGSEVKVTLYLEEGKELCIDASVVYVKGVYGDLFKTLPGMALEFKNLNAEQSEILRNLVKKLLTDDIVDSQEETVIEE
jgi:CheY-like chemotaxis protein/Tfp pilus assembly protein PilZ